MAFVQSSGSVQSLSRPTYSTPQRISLSSTFSADYLQIYKTQDAVRMVIGFLARNIAQLGLHTYRRKGDTDRERLTDHPLARLLNQPNPWTTKYRFLEALVTDKAIYDVAYLLKVGGPAAPGLVRLPPRLVIPKGDNWLTPDEFEVAGTKGKLIIPADKMVYFRGYGGDSDIGMSPLEALRRTLREEWTGSEMREQIMRNGARASGYIKRPPVSEAGQWSIEAKQRFRDQWQAQYAGDTGSGAGGTPILEDGMEFQPVSQSAKELQYVEGRKLTREEVAAQYFVSPPMVGILDHATFSNITELHKMLYQDTLGPWLTMIQDEIMLQLAPDFANTKDVYSEFNLREKLSGSFEEQQEALQKAVGGPWMTINEARARLNLPPVDGGDELIRPLNTTQNGDQEPVPAEPAPALEPTPTDEVDDEDDQEDDD